ncbi:hypothetical protein HUG15_20080 [Salicibibacter cibarius]|uniref:DUF5362 domain-containing protein n=1 Tax=Salicibibacter cibarius TaxID=2743000 RepID=A0A7T7CD53_9BACI|nr:DUF5362 family protein [Salicibibacter cibarius]QQK77654.1 hypothetical protein HUG15_20080 [Salicibibacter cibarius]
MDPFEKHLKRIHVWGRVLGIIMIISGSLYALVGLPSFLIGAAPGVLMVIMGVFIFKTSTSAQKAMESKDIHVFAVLFDNYGRVLMIGSITAIVTIGLAVVFMAIFSLMILGSF